MNTENLQRDTCVLVPESREQTLLSDDINQITDLCINKTPPATGDFNLLYCVYKKITI